ncbi:MAG: site-specific DNA-methyltransferase [Chloroflexi bacterium]|nr:site-specific DNA-methyltransferase [Chloroflexota bacterium]
MELASQLTALLQQDGRFYANNQLLKNQVTEYALKLDRELLRLLLSHDRLKAHFFVDIDGVLVFDRDKFVRFINHKAFLPDSYTSFKNKIGLATADGRYLHENRDVVLVWPYKDCVLEGGQTKEEQKRDEIFWNETLAPDDVDRLLAPKLLTNWRRYDANGRHEVTELQATDNLIIKGNNLLALALLKKRFAGKVKLIYIDPPYNMGGDSFQYNDRFNHSTWLTFMKNRLSVAKELLRPDGALFVQIDHHELAYLTAILDELFGVENRAQIISIKAASPSGFKAYNPGPIDVTEFVLFYTKDKSRFQFRTNYVPAAYHSNYNKYVEKVKGEEDVSSWKVIPLKQKVLESYARGSLKLSGK